MRPLNKETETIKPALTETEWECGTTPLPQIERGIRLQQSESGLYVDGKHYVGPQLHALAAFALYGQPYGFTWGMARFLRSRCFFESHGIGCGDEAGKCGYCEIADRISALLPPEGV